MNETCCLFKCSTELYLLFLLLLLLFLYFFIFFKRLLNTPQRYNTNATINYKYITLHYTMNFNGKVTIQKKKKIRFKYRQHYGTESKGRAHFLLNLPM